MPSSLMIDRRLLMTGAAAAMLRPAHGEILASPADYPAKRVTVVSPEVAGSVADQFLGALLGAMLPSFPQGFQLTQLPTTGGAVAARTVAKADPDGYTLMIGAPETQAIAPELLRQPGYDVETAFDTICGLCDVPLVVVASRTLAAKTLRQLIELAANQPVRYRFGSPGVGSFSHMAAELFKLRARIEANHAPFGSELQVVHALAAQQIDFAILPYGAVSEAVRTGQVKLFGQLGNSRDNRLSNVPTMVEAGVANLELSGWFGVYAPAKTPGTALDRIGAAIRSALQTVSIQQLIETSGLVTAFRAPKDLDALASTQRKLFAELIRLKSLQIG